MTNNNTLKESKVMFKDSEMTLVNKTYDEWKVEIIEQTRKDRDEEIVGVIKNILEERNSDHFTVYQVCSNIINQISNTTTQISADGKYAKINGQLYKNEDGNITELSNTN